MLKETASQKIRALVVNPPAAPVKPKTEDEAAEVRDALGDTQAALASALERLRKLEQGT